MDNREMLLATLNHLNEWDSTDDAPALTPDQQTVKVFTPDAQATWFLYDKDTSSLEDGVRYFGLCDLGLGFPELGWVDHNELMDVRGPMGLPVELDISGTVTIEQAYERVGESLPDWIEKNRVTVDAGDESNPRPRR